MEINKIYNVFKLINKKEIKEIKQRVPQDFSENVYVHFIKAYEKIINGERDLYF